MTHTFICQFDKLKQQSSCVRYSFFSLSLSFSLTLSISHFPSFSCNRYKSRWHAFIDFAECLCFPLMSQLFIYLMGEGWGPSGSGSFHSPSRAPPEGFPVTHEKAPAPTSNLSPQASSRFPVPAAPSSSSATQSWTFTCPSARGRRARARMEPRMAPG